MLARRLAVAALALIAVLVITVSVGGGEDDRYEVRMQLDNALGLRDGSLVTVGGVEVGKVEVELDEDDKVLVTARLDEGRGPVGRDARAFVTSVNLLGQKRLELAKGSTDDPAPSGGVIPASRVTPSTDLDEVLAVLTPDVRARLGVLINEAGATVGGRDTDIARLISTLPPTVSKATEVVDRVTGDNDQLARLVRRSDRLIADLTAERRSVVRLVDSAGRAAGSVVTKRAELQSTLREAPGMLATLQGFLGELERTTVPLGPAARDIARTAPEIERVLTELPAFQKAAAPALDQAVDTAPALTRLAAGATPVLRRATPTLARLAGVATDLVPVTDMLDRSVHNLIGTVDNWSRAVQYRDGLSHIFRGEAGYSAQTVEGLLGRYMRLLDGGTKTTKTARKKRTPAKDTGAAPSAAPQRDRAPERKPLLPIVPELEKGVDDVVDGVLGAVGETLAPKGPDGRRGDTPVQPLLDFLLKP